MLNWLYKFFYPNYFVWHYNAEQKDVFLTFDDGPTPELTPFILDTLEKHGVKATFFCVGHNIEKHPELFKRITDAGHLIGNHTYNHLNGWKTTTDAYFENVEQFESLYKTKLFRPPYGRISRKQAAIIKETHKIIMWTVITYDFLQHLSPEKCLKNALRNTSEGDIVIFHDNLKSIKNVTYALPLFIGKMIEKGFNFRTIY